MHAFVCSLLEIRLLGCLSSLHFFFGFVPIFLPYTPFFDLTSPGKRQISIRSKSVKKKSGSQLQPKIGKRQKKFYRLNRVPWGELEDPPWWFFRVNFFIRFLDVSTGFSAQQKFPDKRFLTKVPHFFFTDGPLKVMAAIFLQYSSPR